MNRRANDKRPVIEKDGGEFPHQIQQDEMERVMVDIMGVCTGMLILWLAASIIL